MEDEQRSKEKIQEVINTLEKFLNLIEKFDSLKSILGIESRQILKLKESISSILKFLKFSLYAYEKEELKQLTEDYQIYGVGVFLFFKKKYPKIYKSFSSMGLQIQLYPLKKPIELLEELKEIFNLVNASFPVLFKKEVNDFEEEFLNKELKPMNYLVKNYPSYRRLNDMMSYITKDVISEYLPEVKDYYNDLSHKINEANLQDDPNELSNLLKEQAIPNGLKEKQEEIMKKLKDIQEYSEDHFGIPEEECRILLNLTEKIDAFNIDLIKFLNRLIHIKQEGNVEYSYIDKNSKKKDAYYSIKYSGPVRHFLKNFLKNELKKSFPNLSGFLEIYLNLSKLRNIEGHSSPIIDLIDESNFILRLKGKKKGLQVNKEKLKKQLATYTFFSEVIINFIANIN